MPVWGERPNSSCGVPDTKIGQVCLVWASAPEFSFEGLDLGHKERTQAESLSPLQPLPHPRTSQARGLLPACTPCELRGFSSAWSRAVTAEAVELGPLHIAVAIQEGEDDLFGCLVVLIHIAYFKP